MTQAPNADAVTQAFSDIPALLEAAPALQTRGRFLDCDCRLGPMEQPFFVSIRAGRIVEFTAQPSLMRSWRFSYRATPLAWSGYWKPMPKPGFPDLLALTKRGEAVLEGDDAEVLRKLPISEQMPPLPPVRAGGVQAHQRNARSVLLEIDPVHVTADVDMDIAADHWLDLPVHAAAFA